MLDILKANFCLNYKSSTVLKITLSFINKWTSYRKHNYKNFFPLILMEIKTILLIMHWANYCNCILSIKINIYLYLSKLLQSTPFKESLQWNIYCSLFFILNSLLQLSIFWQKIQISLTLYSYSTTYFFFDWQLVFNCMTISINYLFKKSFYFIVN